MGSGQAVRFALFAFVAAAIGASASPAAFPTRPPVKSFAPDFEVGRSGFGIAQADDSRLFVGNSNGVLVFDGERWSRVALPNHDLARSLAADGHGRVYVGGHETFGYLEQDATGLDVFHDLVPKFAALLGRDERFADIWDTFVYPEGIFFCGVTHVFRYQPTTGATMVWRHEGRFGAMVRHRGEVLLQFRGEGLRRLRGDAWEPLAGSEPFKDLVYQLIPTPEGGLLTTARDGRWRELRNGKIFDRAMPAGMPRSTQFPHYAALGHGRVALASDDGQFHLLDLAQQSWQRWSLGGTATRGITVANDGSVLVVSDEATYRVDLPSPWTSFDHAQGLSSSAERATAWNGRTYISSSSDLLKVELRPDGTVGLTKTGWTSVGAHDLLPLDARRALLADTYAVRLIENGSAREITRKTLMPLHFKRSRFHSDRVYVATRTGLATLAGDGSEWRLLLDPDQGAELLIDSIVETAADELWLGTARDGVLRYRLDAAGTAVAERVAYGPAQGLSYGMPRKASVARIEGVGVVATTETGIWRFDGQRFEPFQLDGLAALRAPGETLAFVDGAAGTLWAFSERNIYRKPAGGAWRLEPVTELRRGAFRSATREADGAMLFVASGGVLRFDPAQQPPRPAPNQVELRAMILRDADGDHRLPLDGREIEIPQGRLSMIFEFSLAELARPGDVLYQARLLPVDTGYESWAAPARYSYTNLAAADFVFELSGRDPQGNETHIEPLRFTVTPPWYRSTWAKALYATLAAIGLALITLFATRWRTRRLALANIRLESIAHLDGLTGIPNRRRLDEYLKSVWENSAYRGRPISVLIMDVDHFKKYNDQHGHPAGDQLLKALATRLSNCLRRAEDLFARYGGEEFLAVLPGADREVARGVAETMRACIEESTLGATISVGVATAIPAEGARLEALLGDADAALYAAKHAGRNCVKVSLK